MCISHLFTQAAYTFTLKASPTYDTAFVVTTKTNQEDFLTLCLTSHVEGIVFSVFKFTCICLLKPRLAYQMAKTWKPFCRQHTT